MGPRCAGTRLQAPLQPIGCSLACMNILDDIDDNCWLAGSLYKNVSNNFLKTMKARLRKKTLPWMNGKIRKMMNKGFKALLGPLHGLIT